MYRFYRWFKKYELYILPVLVVSYIFSYLFTNNLPKIGQALPAGRYRQVLRALRGAGHAGGAPPHRG